MANLRTTHLLFIVFALAWAVIVLRAVINVKGPEDFVVTVTDAEVQSFAKQQLSDLQVRSFTEDVELCGIIFEDSNGDLGASAIIEGNRASCDINYFDEPGMAPIASFHTHGAYGEEFDSEVPSTLDLESDIANQMDGYISTPGGRFWRIDWREQQALLECGPSCLPTDPTHQPCAGFPPKREYTLANLRARFDDTTSRC
ncbi:MAG: DUF4329 domain-containing protein [Erythrobacter sp.]